MSNNQKKKLLLIGSASVHIQNYYHLVNDYFAEVMVVTNESIDYCPHAKISFELRNPFNVYTSIQAIKKVIHEFNPDIIHVHQANTFGFMATMANKRRIPMVLTTLGSDVLILPKRGFLYRYIVKKSLKNADFITADARYMAEAIHGLIGQKDVTIANFGIDILPMPNTYKKENILYSNRLHKDLYNIDKIISGSATFLKENTEWSLIIAANGNNTEDLKAQAKELISDNQVSFIGFVNAEVNRANYLKSAIYISIPNSDGTAISLLEAMAYGAIPVVSDLPANREWIVDGENGIIVHDGNVDAAIRRAMLLSGTDVAQRNAKIVSERGSKPANRKIFLALYNQCQ
jgi:glycosyltransferase involved in cell wall biosynthesis